MALKAQILCLLVACAILVNADVQLKLLWPEARGVDDPAPINCGNRVYQNGVNLGQKCGVCGDDTDVEVETPRAHEANGRLDQNASITDAPKGKLFQVKFEISPPNGYIEFDYCNLDKNATETQKCFKSLNIYRHHYSATKLAHIPANERESLIYSAFLVELPNIECAKCVLRMTWYPETEGVNLRNGQLKMLRSCANVRIQ